MNFIRRSFWITIILFSCVGCDQVTKSLARQSLPQSGTISFLYDMVRLEYVENPGAFLGLGAHATKDMRSLVFIALAGLLTAGIVYLFKARELTKPKTIATSLLLAGGIGNLIDRIVNDGRVVDFLNIGIGPLRSGIFNVADMAITAGFIWILVLLRKDSVEGWKETRNRESI